MENKKKKVCVLFGGNSPEYEVSLESAYSIITNISDEYEVVLIGITKDGNWYRYYGSVENIISDTWYSKDECTSVVISPNVSDHGIIEYSDNEIKKTYIDVFFPILHGKNGEDGTVQGLIELSGVPLVGCKTLSSALCMDKYIQHELVIKKGLNAARGILIHNYEDYNDYKYELNLIGFPMFVKPLRTGSSFGISKVNSYDELEGAIKKAFKYDSKIIIEENIEGIEVGCAVIGNEELLVGAVDEIILKNKDGFFGYDDKYYNRTSEIICPATHFSDDKKEEIKAFALEVYRILDCSGFARIDLFVKDNGDIYLNEVNTIPGFTVHSRFPAMLGCIGLTYAEVVDKLIKLECK